MKDGLGVQIRRSLIRGQYRPMFSMHRSVNDLTRA